MSSNALESQGVTLEWDGTNIGEVVSFNGPGGSASIIDVTHLGSTRREKRMGIADEGQISFDINLVPNDAGQIKLRDDRAARTERTCRLFLTDTGGTILTMDAYCTQFSIQGSVDNKIQGSITLEITGEVNWSPVLEAEDTYANGTVEVSVTGDTFSGDVGTAGNWTLIDDDDSGATISDVAETAGVATVTFTGGAAGTYEIQLQAKAAALTGDYPSGILTATLVIA